MSDYDVLVLGGGSAGTSAASAAAAAGARVALADDGEPGGLCILRGCMPTKAMLASAHAMHDTLGLDALGIRLDGGARADFTAIMERKDRLVARFQRAKVREIASGGYDVVKGRCRFAPGPTVLVGERRIEAGAYVIATGSEPTVVPLRGMEGVPVLTSDDVMRLTRQPQSLLVVGGGAVALELGQFFARIGTDVVLVNRTPLLHGLDAELGRELALALASEPHMDLVAPGSIDEVRPDGEGLVAVVRRGDAVREVRADALLMAVGRHAATSGLGLQHVGLAPSMGFLRHDDTMRTSNPRVWVAGDATSKFQLLHVANREGRAAGHNAAGGRPVLRVDYRGTMQTIFTDPPFAQVGLSVEEARDLGHDPVVGVARFPETGRAITMGVEHGVWKLVADRGTGRVLGSSLLGPRADDLIHLVSLMIRYEARVREISDLPWYHPTLSEVMLDLGRDLTRQMEAGPSDTPSKPL